MADIPTLNPDHMPSPAWRGKVPMRDGAGLDTWVWLPGVTQEATPAILIRTPYGDTLSPWARLGVTRYLQAGYALVIQLVRGVGDSDGAFSFCDPLDGADGYDTVEWIAAQGWCTGAVGMDGNSYSGAVQLAAAAARPPHLRCIIPAAPCADHFHEIPYFGGILARQHSLGWAQAVGAQSRANLTPGLLDEAQLLGSPESWSRLLSRPLERAGEDLLHGSFLAHFRNLVAHSSFDDWWRERTLQASDFAGIDVPVLLVSGCFDLGAGPQRVWRLLEENAPGGSERAFLIGPWDHGQTYSGGAEEYGPYEFGASAAFDLFAARLAFFERHLKGAGPGPQLPGRVHAFFTGASTWRSFDSLPPAESKPTPLYLSSGGRANSVRGDGRLTWAKPREDEPADSFISDPSLPFVPVMATLDAHQVLDLRETERSHDVLVYTTDPVSESMAVFGEFEVLLHLMADTPDCDVVCQLAEVRSEDATIRISWGALRLRCREGMHREAALIPGQPVLARVRMTYVAHEIPAGGRLRLIIGATLFPFLDPNPNTGEPIHSAVRVQKARETIFHDAARASHILLPLLPAAANRIGDKPA